MHTSWQNNLLELARETNLRQYGTTFFAALTTQLL
jgi:hypothetical protein